MSKANKKIKSSGLLVLALFTSLPAAATVSVQNYTSAANTTYTMTEDAMMEVAPRDPTWTGQHPFFSVHYNWINDPLVQYNLERTQRTATLVDGIQTLDLTVGWFVTRRVSLDFSMPLDLVHPGDHANQFALGDARIFGKWRVTNDDAIVAVSLIPELRLPTGNGSLFISDGSVSPGLLVAIEHDFGPIRAAVNLGYRYAGSAQYQELSYTQRVPLALGVFIPIGAHWGINAEAAGSVVLPSDRFNNPGEIYAGAHYQLNRELTFLGGLGMGSFNSQAGNDARLSMGVRFSPMLSKVLPPRRYSISCIGNRLDHVIPFLQFFSHATQV